MVYDARVPKQKYPTHEEREARRVSFRTADLSALSRYAYIAGLGGTFTVLYMGYLAWKRGALQRGWGILSDVPADPNLSMLFVLAVIAAVMFVIELAIRLRVEQGHVIRVAESLKKGDYLPFLGECILIYVTELAMLALAFAFYRAAGEYGFGRKGGDYYKPWFTLMPILWGIYLYGGLPYVILTRALQHDPKADRKQAAFTALKAVRLLVHKFTEGHVAAPQPFDRHDWSSLRGLGVKFFFVPLMTVFFVDQFSHLVGNYGYAFGNNPTFGVHDFHNVSYTIVFSVDVGLAWAGYVVSSRWIKNGIFSAEPTVLGWLVALLSYPPFNRTFGYYFSTPGETAFFGIASQRAVWVLAVMSTASFVVYAAATVCFGLRFSNLTHRGIITTGPYALVRHPAYAAKNFSWWCVMFPVAIYHAGVQRSAGPLLQVVGLVALSGMYYMRAITEEKHLRRDPEYRAYMKKVPHRFIPGVF